MNRALLLSSLLLLGCVGSASEIADAATTPDDAGTVGDDAGTAIDAGIRTDAGSVGDAGTTDAGIADAGSSWGPLRIPLVNPMDLGATGDGVANDLPALNAAVQALTDGGIVYFPAGKRFRKNDLLRIDRAHVKLWSPNRQAELFGAVQGTRRRQAILIQRDGCGVFGLKLTSDAAARFDALEDNQISFDHVSRGEVVGCEVQNSAAAGLFLYGSRDTWLEGNFIHDTWADHIHHTDGARRSWCWDNFISNGAPSNGDDGIACVTYGVSSPRCGEMEWWNNTILHTGWGRGFSVIGGEDIVMHHNWAIGVAGAGVIVASEPSYDSASSARVTAHDNWLLRCAHAIGHPGILVSGASTTAGALTDLTFRDNVVVATVSGSAYRTEGATANVSNTNLSTLASALPTEPTAASVVLRDTSVLRTRDSFFAPVNARVGLYRVEVRRAGAGFEQRFQYVLQGAASDVSAFTLGRDARVFSVGAQAVAVIWSAEGLVAPAGLQAVTFDALRTPALAAVWAQLDRP